MKRSNRSGGSGNRTGRSGTGSKRSSSRSSDKPFSGGKKFGSSEKGDKWRDKDDKPFRERKERSDKEDDRGGYRKKSGGSYSGAGKFSRSDSDKKSYGNKSFGDRKRDGGSDEGKRPYRKKSEDSFSDDRKFKRSERDGDKKSYGRSYGDRKRDAGSDEGKRPYRKKSEGSYSDDRKFKRTEREGDKKSYGRSYGDRKRETGSDEGKRSFGKRSGDSFSGERKFSRSDKGDFRKEDRGGFRRDKDKFEEKGERRSFSRDKDSGFSDEKKFKSRDRENKWGEKEEKGFGARRERSEGSWKIKHGDHHDPRNKETNEDGGVKKRFGDDREEKKHRDREGYKDRKGYKKHDDGDGDGYKRDRKDHKEKRSHKSSGHSEKNEDGLTRLNKYLSNAGIASRREADELIKSGVVKVNGVTITEMGFKVKAGDDVTFEGSSIKGERKVYLLLNKPKDYITTTDDPSDRRTVMHLVENACRERIYPVGRLDRHTTGVLLFTNDGDLAKKLTHPKHEVKKVYQVTLNKNLKADDFKAITEGIELEDGEIRADDLAFNGEGRKEVGIEIHSGRNRIVRRIFEHLGYEVLKLDRVVFAGLTKKDVPRGRYRFLTEKEVSFLKMLG